MKVLIVGSDYWPDTHATRNKLGRALDELPRSSMLLTFGGETGCDELVYKLIQTRDLSIIECSDMLKQAEAMADTQRSAEDIAIELMFKKNDWESSKIEKLIIGCACVRDCKMAVAADAYFRRIGRYNIEVLA